MTARSTSTGFQPFTGGDDRRGARRETLLWIASRGSAIVLAVCVVAHLITMVIAVRAGLSAEAVLARTRGSIGWAAFYAIFVLAVAVHGPIGLRTVLREVLGTRSRAVDVTMVAFALLLLVMGWRAVWAVTAP